MLPTQFDSQFRVVSVDNLQAMCDEVSSSCHKYHVSEVSNRFVTVEYSNPDEYGNRNPMRVMFPHIPIYGAKGVMLSIHRVINDDMDGEGWQHFQILLDCPVLWRNPTTGDWQAEKKKA